MTAATRSRLLLGLKVFGTLVLITFLLTKLPLREVETALHSPR